MSRYEVHRGTIKAVDLNGKTNEEWLTTKLKEIGDNPNNYDFSYDEEIEEALYQIQNKTGTKYSYINTYIYEWLKHTETEDIDSFCQVSNNGDDTFDVFCQFWNGGTYLEEVMGDCEQLQV